MIKDPDLAKAWQIIDQMHPGQIYDLSRIPEGRRELFIACAKKYIDHYRTAEFSNDYTKLKKIIPWNY